MPNPGSWRAATKRPANFNCKKVLAVREACSTAKMPVTGRSLVLDGAYFTQLLGGDIVARSFMVPIAQPGVVEAQIRRLGGFDMFETVILLENGDKLFGFAAHPRCLAVAMRYLMPVADYDEAGAVIAPDTGLTFGYLRYTECTARKRAPANAERILHSRRSGKRAATAFSSRSSVSAASRKPSATASSAS